VVPTFQDSCRFLASKNKEIAERLGFAHVVFISTRMIVRNLERRPWRATLTVVGMSFAVAILIVGF
jgi:putative ABC transport system permease protein